MNQIFGALDALGANSIYAVGDHHLLASHHTTKCTISNVPLNFLFCHDLCTDNNGEISEQIEITHEHSIQKYESESAGIGSKIDDFGLFWMLVIGIYHTDVGSIIYLPIEKWLEIISKISPNDQSYSHIFIRLRFRKLKETFSIQVLSNLLLMEWSWLKLITGWNSKTNANTTKLFSGSTRSSVLRSTLLEIGLPNLSLVVKCLTFLSNLNVVLINTFYSIDTILFPYFIQMIFFACI